jgi:hypothetical protein
VIAVNEAAKEQQGRNVIGNKVAVIGDKVKVIGVKAAVISDKAIVTGDKESVIGVKNAVKCCDCNGRGGAPASRPTPQKSNHHRGSGSFR